MDLLLIFTCRGFLLKNAVSITFLVSLKNTTMSNMLISVFYLKKLQQHSVISVFSVVALLSLYIGILISHGKECKN